MFSTKVIIAVALCISIISSYFLLVFTNAETSDLIGPFSCLFALLLFILGARLRHFKRNTRIQNIADTFGLSYDGKLMVGNIDGCGITLSVAESEVSVPRTKLHEDINRFVFKTNIRMEIRPQEMIPPIVIQGAKNIPPLNMKELDVVFKRSKEKFRAYTTISEEQPPAFVDNKDIFRLMLEIRSKGIVSTIAKSAIILTQTDVADTQDGPERLLPELFRNGFSLRQLISPTSNTETMTNS